MYVQQAEAGGSFIYVLLLSLAQECSTVSMYQGMCLVWAVKTSLSQNHRMVWVGRDLKAHATPIPAAGRAVPHQLRLPRAPFSLGLSTSRDGAPQLLWAAVPAPHCPLSENIPPDI